MQNFFNNWHNLVLGKFEKHQNRCFVGKYEYKATKPNIQHELGEDSLQNSILKIVQATTKTILKDYQKVLVCYKGPINECISQFSLTIVFY